MQVDNMELSKQEQLRVMQLWNDWENFIGMLLERMVKDYGDELIRRDSEWETLRQSIEYSAKKQVLVDLKKILSKHYE